ncbi:MAG TPA: MucR family transcriptional regulator [Alphaproteobacteria bacterium]|mgnify:CR=1 FL=1|nr:MucR family transcriptional regulator [Micavibrio sp.]MBK9563412.1 MucR family transcriptional regulator [Micavibrio sp.]HQX28025.1 MucR family transcriptional regulator [Alphaproteobacteria bacterium]
MTDQTSRDDVLALTTEIVSAYLSNNSTAANDIPSLIEQVFKTLSNVNAEGGALADRPQPAVPIKKSVNPDYIVCLEDGKKLKMLKRYLKTAYNMTPEQYRERWGLPSDYPMVAPNYARQRSKLAKDIGLGTRSR